MRLKPIATGINIFAQSPKLGPDAPENLAGKGLVLQSKDRKWSAQLDMGETSFEGTELVWPVKGAYSWRSEGKRAWLRAEDSAGEGWVLQAELEMSLEELPFIQVGTQRLRGLFRGSWSSGKESQLLQGSFYIRE